MNFRAVGLAVSVLQLVLMSAYVVLETVYGDGFLSGLAGFATILVFAAVGLAILSRHPRHFVGLLFCLSQIGWAVNNPAGSYARAGVLPFTWLAIWLYTWPGILSAGLTVLLLLVFPDGRFLSARWRRFGQAVLATAAIGAVAAALAPGPIDASIGIETTNPFGLGGAVGEVAAAVGAVAFPLQVPQYLAAAIGMVLRYRRSGHVEREQLKWFATSVGLAASLIVVELVLMGVYPNPSSSPLWAQVFGQLTIFSVSLIPIAAGFAILRYRLYDIDVLINRTVVYATVSAVLVATYLVGVALFEFVLSPFTSGSGPAIAASTLGVVALFQPIRARIQSAVDRRFYRQKYDAARTLDAFAARLRDQIDLDAVQVELLNAVGETVHPARVSLWLK
jgi:hypothetical protein